MIFFDGIETNDAVVQNGHICLGSYDVEEVIKHMLNIIRVRNAGLYLCDDVYDVAVDVEGAEQEAKSIMREYMIDEKLDELKRYVYYHLYNFNWYTNGFKTIAESVAYAIFGDTTEYNTKNIEAVGKIIDNTAHDLMERIGRTETRLRVLEWASKYFDYM